MVAFTLSMTSDHDDVHTAFVRHIQSGKIWEQPFMHSVVSIEWAADGCTLFYTEPDALGRPHRVMRSPAYTGVGSGSGRRLATGVTHSTVAPNSKPILVIEEDDPRYFVEMQRTKDWAYLAININSKLSSEVRTRAYDPVPLP